MNVLISHINFIKRAQRIQTMKQSKQKILVLIFICHIFIIQCSRQILIDDWLVWSIYESMTREFWPRLISLIKLIDQKFKKNSYWRPRILSFSWPTGHVNVIRKNFFIYLVMWLIMENKIFFPSRAKNLSNQPITF
jgi:hypothetical protein